MKTFLAWFDEQRLYWLLQAMAVMTFGLMIWCAIVADNRFAVIVDATIAGFSASNVLHNVLHRRRSRAFDRMVKVAEEQQVMLKEMGEIKSREIADALADRMGGEIVSIVPPPAPPTKH